MKTLNLLKVGEDIDIADIYRNLTYYDNLFVVQTLNGDYYTVSLVRNKFKNKFYFCIYNYHGQRSSNYIEPSDIFYIEELK